MPARVNDVAGGTRGVNAAAARRRAQAQDQAGGQQAGRARARGQAGGGDRVELANATHSAQRGQTTAAPREAQGRGQPVEQAGRAANENRAVAARAQREGQPAQNVRRTGQAGGNAGGAQTTQGAQTQDAVQANAAQARRQRDASRNVGTRVDVAV